MSTTTNAHQRIVVVVWVHPDLPADRGPSAQWSKAYVRSAPGILRISQIVIVFIAFLCAITNPYYYNGAGWAQSAQLTSIVNGIIWFGLNLLNVIPRLTVNHYIEAFLFGILSIALFTAAATLAGGASSVSSSALAASAFFTFLACALWTVDTVFMALQLKAARDGQSAPAASDTGASDAVGDRRVFLQQQTGPAAINVNAQSFSHTSGGDWSTSSKPPAYSVGY